MRNNRLTALLLSVLLATAAIPAASAAEAEQPETPNPVPQTAITGDTLIGDLNHDGTVNVLDATEMQIFLAGDNTPLSVQHLRVMDVNGDGSVSILDATELQRYAAEFPCSTFVGRRYADIYPETETTIAPTEPPTENTTAAPTEPPTEITTAAPTEPPTENTTAAPTEPPTEITTAAQTEPPTENTTAAQTEPPTEITTAAPTEPPTEITTAAQTEPPTEPLYIQLDVNTLTLGDTDYYALTYSTNGALPAAPSFSSDNPSVAIVTNNGFIIARAPGKATVTCSSGSLSDTCEVTVCPTATSLSLIPAELTLGVGESVALECMMDDGAVAFQRYFSSSDNAVATVHTSGGTVTALGAGTAEITCSLLNGLKAVCHITVLPLADTVTLNQTEVSMSLGGSFTFASAVPENTAAYCRAYGSEDSSVVEMLPSGEAKATGVGTTRVYCEIAGGARAYATVTVTEPTLRGIMIQHLTEQVGNNNISYATYLNEHSDLYASMDFPWCAIFAWTTLDQFAEKAGLENPVAARKQVSGIAVQAMALGALRNRLDNDYIPKPGDLFTTSTLERPYDDGREHIGFVEYVEFDDEGKVVKVHTIEGNFNWELQYPDETVVSRSEWIPEEDRYGAWLCEYIDLEQLFAADPDTGGEE